MERPLPKIDPKKFVAGGNLENIEKLRLAMKEAPALFEELKRLTNEFGILVGKIDAFYENLSRQTPAQ